MSHIPSELSFLSSPPSCIFFCILHVQKLLAEDERIRVAKDKSRIERVDGCFFYLEDTRDSQSHSDTSVTLPISKKIY